MGRLSVLAIPRQENPKENKQTPRRYRPKWISNHREAGAPKGKSLRILERPYRREKQNRIPVKRKRNRNSAMRFPLPGQIIFLKR